MNNATPTLSDETLARYLASQASRDEIERVEAWLQASPEHVEELRAYRKIWENSRGALKGQVDQKPVDVDAAWRKVQSKMPDALPAETPAGKIQELKSDEVSVATPPVQWTFTTLAWAAVIALLLVALGWGYYDRFLNPKTLAVSTTENTLRQVLPDSSVVLLNYHSALTYADGPSGRERRVSLRGEAFFDVAPDDSRPFVIDANGTEIRVVGTSFNVKAYGETVRVDVKSGKVEVRRDLKIIELLPGEGVEARSGNGFKTLLADPNAAAYGTRDFDFTAVRLADVARTLSEAYHADVRLASDSLADCRISVRPQGEDLDETLALIAETLNLTVRKADKIYWIEGSTCQ